ncbi:MAG: Hpt domain-containing protein [Longimicrobiales bacterium]
MDDLKQFFRSALSTRIEALETAATTMEADPVGALATIRRLAHSLRGSGATYGYPQITEAATAVEEAEPEDVPPLLRELIKVLKSVVAELRPQKEQKQAEAAPDDAPAADDTVAAGDDRPAGNAPPPGDPAA